MSLISVPFLGYSGRLCLLAHDSILLCHNVQVDSSSGSAVLDRRSFALSSDQTMISTSAGSIALSPDGYLLLIAERNGEVRGALISSLSIVRGQPYTARVSGAVCLSLLLTTAMEKNIAAVHCASFALPAGQLLLFNRQR